MSNYDYRDRPAYRDSEADPQYARNKHILRWWTKKHDELLKDQISQMHWVWYWDITEIIAQSTQEVVIAHWKENDPKCKTYAWYNVLMYFAIARAQQLGFTRRIRKPKWKVCPLCEHRFREDSLPYPLIERFGIDRLDFCSPCLRDTVLQSSGNQNASKEQIKDYLKNLAEVLQRVPTQNFGEGKNDFATFTDSERLAILQVMKSKPSAQRVKKVFGSWLRALIEAEVLEDGTRQTGRGIQTIAKDGHVCLSLGEKTIDDYLFDHNIPHSIEPRYPDSNYRADFEVNGIFIEYFGLTGNADYDAKTREKKALCKKHGIKLIALYPKDLISDAKLSKKLEPLFS